MPAGATQRSRARREDVVVAIRPVGVLDAFVRVARRREIAEQRAPVRWPGWPRGSAATRLPTRRRRPHTRPPRDRVAQARGACATRAASACRTSARAREPGAWPSGSRSRERTRSSTRRSETWNVAQGALRSPSSAERQHGVVIDRHVPVTRAHKRALQRQRAEQPVTEVEQVHALVDQLAATRDARAAHATRARSRADRRARSAPGRT